MWFIADLRRFLSRVRSADRDFVVAQMRLSGVLSGVPATATPEEIAAAEEVARAAYRLAETRAIDHDSALLLMLKSVNLVKAARAVNEGGDITDPEPEAPVSMRSLP